MKAMPLIAAALLSTALAAGGASAAPKHLLPVPADALARMASANVDPKAPILVRAFKREAEMEVWKRDRAGRYVLVKTFPICRWSGQLGPKRSQGDRQTPEGFYAVTPAQMRPNSTYHLAFDTGFPNAFDRANRASGSALMVHGTCSSSGCYAMTDRGIEEIYAMAREAFAGGQRAFQFQAYPFRLTAENLVRYRNDRNVGFWGQLKEGYDRFEATGEEPTVATGGGRYVFLPYGDRSKEEAAVARMNEQVLRVAELLSKGSPAYRISYSDGGQNRAYAGLDGSVGDVSRPEALASAGMETLVAGSAAPQPYRKPVLRQVPPPPPVPEPVLAQVPQPGQAPNPSDPLPDVLRQALALSAVPSRALLPPGGAPVLAKVPDPVAAVAGQPDATAAVDAIAAKAEPPAPPEPPPPPPPPVRRF